MKISRLFSSFCLFCFLLMSSCNDESASETEAIQESVKFMVISDIHYFDPSLFTLPANAHFLEYLATDRKLIVESSAILKSVLASVQAEKPDFLLIPGDLTKDGEKFDHQTLATMFKTLSDKGIKVLVIPGNHDVNNPDSYSYLQTSKTEIENISASDFSSIYSNCGYGDAIERDATSLSYVSEPVKGLWVMGIDACHYSTLSETAGSISSSTLDWIKTIIAKSKNEKKVLISMMHHGLSEHFSGQSILFPEYVISDWQNVAVTLADLGLKVVFTGHFHAQDIVKTTSASGFIFDIETGSTVTSPCPYRIVTLNALSNSMKIESKSITNVTSSTIPSGTSFQQYAKTYLSTGMKDISYYMLSSPPYNIPGATISAIGLDQVMANAFVAHYAGDETPTDTDNAQVHAVTAAIPSLGMAVKGVWTDIAPDDNNLTINLTTGIASKN